MNIESNPHRRDIRKTARLLSGGHLNARPADEASKPADPQQAYAPKTNIHDEVEFDKLLHKTREELRIVTKAPEPYTGGE